jgi:dTDP-4-dehydrorhamnose reductase
VRVLIYGGDGMLGHQLLKTLRVAHEVRVTLRQSMSNYQDSGLFDPTNSFADIVARSLLCLGDTISSFRPAPIVNCIGLVKQRDNTKDVIANLEINALLKRRLAQLCRAIGARLIHISTDCNAVGRKGMYMEGVSDAEDIYGHTKFLDEEAGPTCLTLRTSIIGRELTRKRSLAECFLEKKTTAVEVVPDEALEVSTFQDFARHSTNAPPL